MVQSLSSVATALALSALFRGVNAVPYPDIRARNGLIARSGGGFRMSASTGASPKPGAPGVIGNFIDQLYTVNVTIGGQEFPVQIDTGSSDLWVISETPIEVTSQTDISVVEPYGVGRASGPIAFADLNIGEYTIKNQAFVNAEKAEDFGFLASDPPIARGILGLAFEEGSPVSFAIQKADKDPKSTRGQTPIQNIFAQSPSTPNFFDIALDRLLDLDETSQGTFTIGNHLPGFEHVEKQPRLQRLPVARWAVTLDAMTVNGKSFQFNKSSVPSVPTGKAAAVLDTGFTFPTLPPAAVDFIYQSIPGWVKLNDTFPQYALPCDAATNLTFVFGGQEFPVHPIDVTNVRTDTFLVNGTETEVTLCTNSFQYLSLDSAQFPGFDLILGDSFLRNVYASFDYGLTDSTGNTSYIQLLSTTDQAEAWEEFPLARDEILPELPQTISPNVLKQSVPGFGSGSSSSSSTSRLTSGALENTIDADSSRVASLLEKYGPIVIGLLAGNIFIGLLLLAIGVTLFLRSIVKGGAKARSINPSYAPVRFKEAESGSHVEPYSD